MFVFNACALFVLARGVALFQTGYEYLLYILKSLFADCEPLSDGCDDILILQTLGSATLLS